MHAGESNIVIIKRVLEHIYNPSYILGFITNLLRHFDPETHFEF